MELNLTKLRVLTWYNKQIMQKLSRKEQYKLYMVIIYNDKCWRV